MLRAGIRTITAFSSVFRTAPAAQASIIQLQHYAKKKGNHTAAEENTVSESTFDLENLKQEMSGATVQLEKEFSAMRTGVATPGMLDNIMVEAYGAKQKMNKVAQVLVKEPQLLNVQVYDPSITDAVVKAIQLADMGLNPQVDKNMLRIPLPKMTKENRQKLAKGVHKMAEDAKVHVRRVRQHAMNHLHKEKKAKVLSEDETKSIEKQVQSVTDDFMKKVDEMMKKKEQSILSG